MTGAILRLLLFLLPFVLFYLWVKLAKGKKSDVGLDPKIERNLKIGMAVAAMLFAFAVYKTVTSGEGTTELDYVPPNQGEDGIEPGHFEENTTEDVTEEETTENATEDDSGDSHIH